MKDRTKKLIKIGGLAVALALIGGTFAFTNIGQSVLNITEDTNRPEHGGRVHDYFHDESGNKDVFAENFGMQPIFSRIRLTELMTINDISVVPLATGQNVDNPETWPAYIPEIDGNEWLTGYRAPLAGEDPGSHPLDVYYRLALGQSGSGRPWFMPTFNLNPSDSVSAAAGTALDVVTGGVTHPGEGTEDYWESGQVANALPSRPSDSQEEHPTRQVLAQDERVMTFEQWQFRKNQSIGDFENFDGVGNFWVVDEATGWAYWANVLEPGQATSFYVDAKLPQGRGSGNSGLDSINGDWNYTLHVMGEFAGTSEGNVNVILGVSDVAGRHIWSTVAEELELEDWDFSDG